MISILPISGQVRPYWQYAVSRFLWIQFPGLLLLIAFLFSLHWRKGGFGGLGQSISFSSFSGLSGLAIVAYLIPSIAVYLPFHSMILRHQYSLLRQDVGGFPIGVLYVGYSLTICSVSVLMYERIQTSKYDTPSSSPGD